MTMLVGEEVVAEAPTTEEQEALIKAGALQSQTAMLGQAAQAGHHNLHMQVMVAILASATVLGLHHPMQVNPVVRHLVVASMRLVEIAALVPRVASVANREAPISSEGMVDLVAKEVEVLVASQTRAQAGPLAVAQWHKMVRVLAAKALASRMDLVAIRAAFLASRADSEHSKVSKGRASVASRLVMAASLSLVALVVSREALVGSKAVSVAHREDPVASRADLVVHKVANREDLVVHKVANRVVLVASKVASAASHRVAGSVSNRVVLVVNRVANKVDSVASKVAALVDSKAGLGANREASVVNRAALVANRVALAVSSPGSEEMLVALVEKVAAASVVPAPALETKAEALVVVAGKCTQKCILARTSNLSGSSIE